MTSSSIPFAAEVKAGVQLQPEKSQVFVLSLSALTAMSLITTFIFLWYKHDFWWMPSFFTVAFGCGSIFTWHKSHRNVDLAGSTPTTISGDGNGFQITTDSRALTPENSLHLLEKAVSILCHRQALPEPDGLVNRNGQPDPEAKTVAIERVRQANEKAHQQAIDTVRLFVGENSELLAEQPKIKRHPQVVNNIDAASATAYAPMVDKER